MGECSDENHAAESLMRVVVTGGLLCVFLAAGCASVNPPPPVAPSPTVEPQFEPEPVALGELARRAT